MATKKGTRNFTIDQTHQNLEFLVLWMMATSNPTWAGAGNGGGFFLQRALNGDGVQHWDLHDPSEVSDLPTHLNPSTFFQALTWGIDPQSPNMLCVEKFLNGFLGDPNFSGDFAQVSEDFVDASKAVLATITVSGKQVARYDDHTCPSLAEVQQLVADIAQATAALKRSKMARPQNKK
jgi:hypothetical protein